jgi:hypothetical protein
MQSDLLRFRPCELDYWEERTGLLASPWRRINGGTLCAGAGMNPAAQYFIAALQAVGKEFSS